MLNDLLLDLQSEKDKTISLENQVSKISFLKYVYIKL